MPDGNAAGLSDMRSLNSTITAITTLRVKLNIAGEFNGDLYGYLRHIQGGTTNFCVLLNRPGRSSTSLSGYADAGLNITLDDSGTSADIHNYRTATNLPSGMSLVGIWQTDRRAVDPGAVLDTSARTTSLSSFNEASGSGEWTLFLADMESGGTNMLVSWELQITGATRPTVTWPAPANIVYGTALGPTQLNASSPVPGTFAYSPPAGTMMNSGNGQMLTVIFTPTDSTSYTPVATNVSISVLKAALTVTANNTNKIYGAAVPAFRANYSGFVNGDSTNQLTSQAVLTTTATAASPTGLYSITPSGASSSNYTIAYVSGTLTISKASTTGIVSSSKNPSLTTDGVTFTLALSPVAPGTGIPTGFVQFKIDGATSGSPVALSGGVAGYTPPVMIAGTHSIVAEYAGDINFAGTTNSLIPVQVVNTPPLAGIDTIERGLTNGTKVHIATLLGNDTDPDGDAISFVSVAGLSTNGAAITRTMDWIDYTPAARPTIEDAFEYIIVDGRGATSRGTVRVLVRDDELPSLNLVIIDRGDGSYLIRFDGIPGKTYRVQYNENLEIPSWQELSSGIANEFGVFQIIDVPPGGSPQRYYRSVFP